MTVPSCGRQLHLRLALLEPGSFLETLANLDRDSQHVPSAEMNRLRGRGLRKRDEDELVLGNEGRNQSGSL